MLFEYILSMFLYQICLPIPCIQGLDVAYQNMPYLDRYRYTEITLIQVLISGYRVSGYTVPRFLP